MLAVVLKCTIPCFDRLQSKQSKILNRPLNRNSLHNRLKSVFECRSFRFSRDNGYAPDVPKSGTLCRNRLTLSPINSIPGSSCAIVKKKRETLPRAATDVSEFARVTAARSGLRTGMLACFPFGRRNYTVGKPTACSGPTAFADPLGPPNSRPNAVLAKPFSTSALKVLA
jgi:hypothetical protein